MQKNTKPKVSLIVPIYNVGEYVEKCLRTIQNQTFKDFEVLIINDETKDNSAEIAQKFCDSDSRFHLLNKKNGGLSDSRNYGLNYANGEYVAFIDGDDYIHKDYLKVLYNACINNDADISYCRFKYSYFKSGITLRNPISAKKGVLKKEEALNLLIRDNFLHNYAWNKMYRLSLFKDNNITYPNMYFEDIATSPKLFLHANKLAITDNYLYYYIKRFGSIMSTMNARKINDYFLSVLIIRNYLQYNRVYETYKDSVLSFAKKAYNINKYSIVKQHIFKFDFRKMKTNLKTNKKIYNYIISDNYKATKEFPQLPYYIHQPGRNKK